MRVKITSLINSLRSKFKRNDYSLDFTEVYHKNLFDGDQSISGRGSNLDQTTVLAEELVPLLKKLGVNKLLDVPCGDFNWMRNIDFDGITYIGGDIVSSLIEENQKKFGNSQRTFERIDLVSTPLPTADALFCRDCLVHLNYRQIFDALKNIKKSQITYLMATTFTERRQNEDLIEGIWRPLNLRLAPFNLPEPLAVLNEKCPEGNGAWADKSIGVWRVRDL